MSNNTTVSVKTKKFCLWVENELIASDLNHVFYVKNYRDKEIDTDTIHYILATPETEEATIKAVAWRTIKSGCLPEIYTTNQPLEVLLNGSAMVAKDLAIQIFEFAQPFDQWVIRQESQPLRLKQATKVAEAALAFLEDPEKSVELQSLQQRCGCSSWDWGKLVEKLEAKFYKELENRGIVSKALAQEQKLKLEIQRWAEEKDLVRKTLIAKNLRKQGISNAEIKTIAAEFQRGVRTPKTNVMSADDFLNDIPEGLSWIFPGILPGAGITILGGSPGAGKSTLAYDAGASFIFGEEFLGEKPSKTGKVLFVTSDEPKEFIKDKLINRGFFGAPGCWLVQNDWDISQWDALEETMENFKPDLVIFDSFSSIHRDPNFDENSSQAKASLYQLNGLLDRHGCPAIMIHHTGKDKDKKGVNKLRGSTAIPAAASMIWLLEGEDKVKTFSMPKTRGTEKLNLEVALNPYKGTFKVLRGLEEVNACKPVIQRIKSHFESIGYDTRLEIEEVRLVVGGSYDTVQKSLRRLCGQGVLVKAPSKKDLRSVVYYLSPKYVPATPPLPTTRLPLSDKSSETLTTYDLNISDKLADKLSDISGHLSDNLSESDKVEEVQSLTENELEQFERTTIPDVGGGGISEVDDQVTELSESQSELPQEENLKGVNIPLKVGSKIRCYPTLRHAQNEWKVKATVIEVEAERGYFKGCTVEYYSRSEKGKVRVRIAGGCGNWILSVVNSH